MEMNREMESVSKPKLEEIAIMTERSVASSSSSSSRGGTSILSSEKILPVPPAVVAEPSTAPSTAPSTVTTSPGIPVIIEPTLSACFVSDINVPDGTTIVPKKTFIKVSNAS